MKAKKFKKDKIINNNTIASLKPKTYAQWQEEYFNFHLFKTKPVSEAWIHGLAKRLYEYAAIHNGISVLHFLYIEGMLRDTFYKWVNKYPYLKQAYDQAKMIMAWNREQKLNNKEHTPQIAHMLIGWYHPEIREEYEYKNKLKDEEEVKYQVLEIPVRCTCSLDDGHDESCACYRIYKSQE